MKWIRRPHISILPLILSAGIIITAFINNYLLPPNNQLLRYFEKTVSISGVISDDIEFKKDDYRIHLKTNFGLVYVMLEKLPSMSLARSDYLTVQGKIQAGFGSYAAFFYRPTVKEI